MHLLFFTFRYVSTNYIHDCIKENEQLDLEQYRLNLTPNTKDASLGGIVCNVSVLEFRKPSGGINIDF